MDQIEVLRTTSPTYDQPTALVANSGGYRLDRVEVLNWGTFHQKVWQLNFDGKICLLTGENGTGKSTLIDALLTLLVSNKKRSYNMSSGSSKRERSEQTYTRGAYQREKGRYDQLSIKYLRDKKSVSALAAFFHNAHTDDRVTVAQFFWYEGDDLKKCLVCSHQELALADILRRVKTPKDLKANIAKLAQTTMFSSFSEYQNYFARYVGLRSVKGLDLFNQVSTIKQIGQLNSFVRQHMLEEVDVSTYMADFFRNFEDLNLSYQAIIKARMQINQLSTIDQEAQKLLQLREKVDIKKQTANYTLPYFAAQQLTALEHQELQLLAAIAKLTQSNQEIDQELLLKEEQQKRIQRAIDGHKGSGELSRLNSEIELHKKLQRVISDKAKGLADLRQALGFDRRLTAEEFIAEAVRAEAMMAANIETRVNLSEEQTQQATLLRENSCQIEELTFESISVEKNRSAVPRKYIQVRDQICDQIGLSAASLPFAAEIIKVKDKEQAWRPAIERLLRPMGLNLLIPEAVFSQVNQYIRSTHLGLKLVLQKIPDGRPQFTEAFDPDSVPSKLEFRPKVAAAHWLKQQLVSRWNFICVKDLRSFSKYDKAITMEGLLKRNAQSSEKDDRSRISDQSLYILGWGSEERLGQLRSQIKELRSEETAITSVIRAIKVRLQELENQNELLRRRLEYRSFKDIDLEPIGKHLDNLQTQKDAVKLEKSEGVDRNDLDRATSELYELRKQRDATLRDLAVKQNLVDQLPRDRAHFERHLKNHKPDKQMDALVCASLKALKLAIDFSDLQATTSAATRIIEGLQKEIERLDDKVSSQSVALTRKLIQFKNDFPEYSIDLSPSIESLEEYLCYYRKLKKESLPSHEARFKKLLTRNIIADVTAFKSTLELAADDIKQDIEDINTSLKTMTYGDRSFVQIKLIKTKDPEIREFQTRLRNAVKSTGDQANAIDLEESFSRIQKLIGKLKSDDNWRQTVTDVRRWSDFLVVESRIDDEQEINYYSDSAGLSGGQKAKLAFTILASAIAHQYGLNSESCDEKTFRFVMIDEAFSKSDEKNSRYALSLFKNLGLQLMVVTPMDKMNLVQPFVERIFLTQIPAGQDTSQIVMIKNNKLVTEKNLIP